MKLTWKQIEARRERRLWVTQIGIPVITVSLATVLAFKDEIKSGAKDLKRRAGEAKNRIVNKLKRSKKDEGQK